MADEIIVPIQYGILFSGKEKLNMEFTSKWIVLEKIILIEAKKKKKT